MRKDILYYEGERLRYDALYRSCAKDCEPAFRMAILQCETIVAALKALQSFEALIPKLCDGK